MRKVMIDKITEKYINESVSVGKLEKYFKAYAKLENHEYTFNIDKERLVFYSNKYKSQKQEKNHLTLEQYIALNVILSTFLSSSIVLWDDCIDLYLHGGQSIKPEINKAMKACECRNLFTSTNKWEYTSQHVEIPYK